MGDMCKFIVGLPIIKLPIYNWLMVIFHSYLVGGLELFAFFHILGTIIPCDSYFFRGVCQPSTRSIMINIHSIIGIMLLTTWFPTIPADYFP